MRCILCVVRIENRSGSATLFRRVLLSDRVLPARNFSTTGVEARFGWSITPARIMLPVRESLRSFGIFRTHDRKPRRARSMGSREDRSALPILPRCGYVQLVGDPTSRADCASCGDARFYHPLFCSGLVCFGMNCRMATVAFMMSCFDRVGAISLRIFSASASPCRAAMANQI